MFSFFLNLQNIRYTMYLGFFYFFMKKRNNEIQQITEGPSFVQANITTQADWDQFVEIDCY